MTVYQFLIVAAVGLAGTVAAGFLLILLIDVLPNLPKRKGR